MTKILASTPSGDRHHGINAIPAAEESTVEESKKRKRVTMNSNPISRKLSKGVRGGVLVLSA
jgi:hypothetical protein